MPYVRRLVVALWLLMLPTASLADPPRGFAERVEALRKQYGSPGATIAIVENGRTTFARGFGVTDLNNPQPVNADTNFATGSTGKAFTAAALAVLVDKGKLAWDDKVIDHMPDFRMYDAWVTREMTVRDLLLHRSGLGLGAGDLLYVPRSSLTRAEVTKRLRHIPPASSFRSGYAYDNILYIVAGRLIEEVGGMSWEQFMLQNVLHPAGMNRATVDGEALKAAGNFARPHARTNGAIRGLGDQQPLAEDVVLPQVAAPAGGLSISANDMARWLTLQLAHGALPDGKRLFSEAQAREMWEPGVLLPASPLPAPLGAANPIFSTYALGWNVRDYRGTRVVMHTGAVFGSIAIVVLIPDRNVGIYVALNSEESALRTGIAYELMDHYLGLPRRDWVAGLDKYLDDRLNAAVAALAAPSAQPAKVGPSLPIALYAGNYSDPWFGTIGVREANGSLAMDFPHWPGISATLEHWQYDTFKTRFSDPSMEPAYVTFALGPDGKVERITMKPVSAAADFSYDYQDLLFTPVAAK